MDDNAIYTALAKGETVNLAYADMLKNLAFDGSLQSLKDIDWLLSAIKNADNSHENAPTRLQKEELIAFLARYSGRVWVQAMGVSEGSVSFMPAGKNSPDILALCQNLRMNVSRPLQARLFGTLANPVLGEDGKPAQDSIYWAVVAEAERGAKILQSADDTQTEMPNTSRKLGLPKIGKKSDTPAPTIEKKVDRRAQVTAVDLLSEARQDLADIPIEEPHRENWQKAWHYLTQFSKITTPSAAQIQMAERAKASLAKLAEHGNLSAHLAQSVLALEQNDAKNAFLHAQSGANAGDARAQKLLSKLYYQGYGCERDTDAAELWLSKAAENGHEGAKVVKSQFAHIQSLRAEQQDERKKDRYYLTAFLIVLAVMVLLVVLL